MVAQPDPLSALQALLEDILPVDLHHSQQDLGTGSYRTATDYLEYVDKDTGFTPLLAAVHYHRGHCAKLVRITITNHAHLFRVL